MKYLITGTTTFVTSVISYMYYVCIINNLKKQFLAGVSIIWVRNEWFTIYGLITFLIATDALNRVNTNDQKAIRFLGFYSIINFIFTYFFIIFSVLFGLLFTFGYFIPCTGACANTYIGFGMIFAIGGGAVSVFYFILVCCNDQFICFN